jgi:hypothetical protein
MIHKGPKAGDLHPVEVGENGQMQFGLFRRDQIATEPLFPKQKPGEAGRRRKEEMS